MYYTKTNLNRRQTLQKAHAENLYGYNVEVHVPVDVRQAYNAVCSLNSISKLMDAIAKKNKIEIEPKEVRRRMPRRRKIAFVYEGVYVYEPVKKPN